MRSTRQHGFTLTELMIVIAAVAVLVGIGLGYYRVVRNGTGAVGSSSSVLQLIASVKSQYQNGDYTGISATTLINSGVVPSGLINATNNGLKNDWGGAITIAPNSYKGGTNNAMLLRYYAVPRDGCNRLIATLQEQFNVVRAGTGTLMPSAVVKDDSASPKVAYTQALASTACNNETNMIYLVTI